MKIDELIERYPTLECCRRSIEYALELMIGSIRTGGKLITCGNGGSAADAQHIVGELMKGFILPRPIERFAPLISARIDQKFPSHAEYLKSNLQGAIPAISLVGETALMTAYSNDKAPDLIFAQQLLGLGRAGDVLMAISTSGNSTNVIYALEVAAAMDIKTIGLTGRTGGKMASMVDVSINAPADHAHTIQEFHLPIYHALCLALEAEFFTTTSVH
ncbi:MAG: SIS domain-containing protein [Selenomonadaceae bacterium]|nr:SIS domain-containing protein [Selenomonadaceae bacterium]